MPVLTLIAGPNGSGKSTVTQSVDFVGRDRLLDPDSIARNLSPSNPSAAAGAAGREVLRRRREYLNERVSFAIETTLSSRGGVELIREAKSRGYETHLVFIGIDSPERCITRIRNRTARGGHSIADADVRRRYARSIAHAAQAARLVDIAKFYDNSGDGPRLTLVATGGIVRWQAQPVPEWLRL